MASGFTSIGVLLITLANFGIPLGAPPAPENPAMQHVAPPECVLYATWAGMATPDANSPNHFEQLLAEPEVQTLVKSLDGSLRQLLNQVAADPGADPSLKQLAKVAPLWVRTAATQSSAIFLSRVEIVEEKLDVTGGLIINAGDQGPALVAELVKLLTTPENPLQTVTVGNLSFKRFVPQEQSPIQYEVTLGVAGPYVVVGIGKESVEGIVQRIRDKKTPQWLTDLQKRLPVERRASLSYLNVKSLTDTFLPLAGPQGSALAESLGAKQIETIESVTGLDESGIVTRTFLKISGEPRGVLTVFNGQAITPEKVGFIPKDANWASVASFNLLRTYNLVASTIAEHAPPAVKQQFESFAEGFEQQFGLRLDTDVLASFGDTWSIWISPADGWLGLTLSVDVVDQEKLAPLLTKLSEMLERGPYTRLKALPFGEQTMYVLLDRGWYVQPTLALTKSRLIFSLSSQGVKSTLTARPEEVGLFGEKQFAAAFAAPGKIIAIDYQNTPKLFEATYGSLTMLSSVAINAINKQPSRYPLPFNSVSLPSGRSIQRHLQPGLTVTRWTDDGIESESHQTLPMPGIGASAPVAVALVLPAVQAAREAARRTGSMNNLKHIALAMHNHHDVYTNFPPAYSTDKEGKPLLSWRVHILPFIEQQELYNQFKLDEPWDSEHNKKLIPRMPAIYRSPNSTAAPGSTVYLAIGGPQGVIIKPTENPSDGRMFGASFADIVDGTSNTLMTVEASDALATPWTKPEEFVPSEKDPLKGLTGLRPGGFLAGLADGSVRFISDKIDLKMLNNLFQRNDGNVIRLP